MVKMQMQIHQTPENQFHPEKLSRHWIYTSTLKYSVVENRDDEIELL